MAFHASARGSRTRDELGDIANRCDFPQDPRQTLPTRQTHHLFLGTILKSGKVPRR
jgi:hypothetical protein